MGHIRIKGANGDLFLGTSETLLIKKAEFPKNDDSFIFTVKLITYLYVLSSFGDERPNMWRPLQSAIKHVTVVENRPERRSVCAMS